MKKRLLVIAAILTAVVGAIVLILALLPARPGVTKANFDRIENGMSYDEIELIFGERGLRVVNLGPPSLPTKEDEVSFPGVRRRHDPPKKTDGNATIEFNEYGQVVRKTWYPRPTTFWQELQRWLPWLPD